MATKKPRPKSDPKCPIYKFTMITESKWALVVLRDLFMQDHKRFKDFKTNNRDITDRALNETLKRLQTLKLVERQVEATTPPTVVYHLTAFGKGLMPVFKTLMDWGQCDGKNWWKEVSKNS